MKTIILITSLLISISAAAQKIVSYDANGEFESVTNYGYIDVHYFSFSKKLVIYYRPDGNSPATAKNELIITGQFDSEYIATLDGETVKFTLYDEWIMITYGSGRIQYLYFNKYDAI